MSGSKKILTTKFCHFSVCFRAERPFAQNLDKNQIPNTREHLIQLFGKSQFLLESANFISNKHNFFVKSWISTRSGSTNLCVCTRGERDHPRAVIVRPLKVSLSRFSWYQNFLLRFFFLPATQNLPRSKQSNFYLMKI